MRFHIYLTGFICINFICIGQNKISIKKNTCCDSLVLRLGLITHTDTLSYSKLAIISGLGVGFKNCIYDASASIESFEVVSNNKKEWVKGNSYNFKKLTHLQNGGEFLIQNCMVNCKNYLNEVKDVLLPTRKIIVLPDK